MSSTGISARVQPGFSIGSMKGEAVNVSMTCKIPDASTPNVHRVCVEVPLIVLPYMRLVARAAAHEATDQAYPQVLVVMRMIPFLDIR